MGLIILLSIVIVLSTTIFVWLIVDHDIDDILLTFLMGVIAIVFTIVLVISVQSYNFDNNKTITYIKPQLKYFEKQPHQILIVVDDTSLYEKDFRWLDTNRIMLMIETYKGKTNKTYVLKD